MTGRAALGAAALALAGCMTTSPNAAPTRTYHSPLARAAIADCLLNRAGSGDFRVSRDAGLTQTLVRVTGFAGTYFLFTLRDAPGGGSDVELRRLNSVAPGLHNAETCFA